MNYKTIFSQGISIDQKTVGFIMLVQYEGLKFPHLEFEIFDTNYRNLGIMSNSLPEFLKASKEAGYCQLVANVRKHNKASKKLLEKNNFILIKEFEKAFSYLTDLRQDKSTLEEIMKIMQKNEKGA